MFRRVLRFLPLLAVPLAFLLHGLGFGPIVTFLATAVAVIPLAAVLGEATEALAARLGPQLGALLSASFGNAAELILGIVALRSGLSTMVKASLTGSIIGNALLVLGLSLLAGGLKHGRQSFDRTPAGLHSTLLVLAVIGLSTPSVLSVMGNAEPPPRLSQAVALILLVTYALNLVFSFLSREDETEVVGGRGERLEQPSWGPWFAAAALGVCTVALAFLSDLLVGAIETAQQEGLLRTLGMSEVFIGVVIVAVVGNAAENSTAIRLAWHNQADAAVGIAIGSSLQIALLVMPVLVFVSLLVAPEPLDLHFTPLELLAVGAAALVLHLVAADGRGHWMEGVLLLAVYLIMAVAFYYQPVTPGT